MKDCELFGFKKLEYGEYGFVGVEFGGVWEEVGDGVARRGRGEVKKVVEIK